MIVSRHFLRRRARVRLKRCCREHPGQTFKVVRAKRGPFRWYVERVEPARKSVL